MAVTEETKGGQEEGAPLLKEEAAMYKGEKEPGAKDAPAHGVPVGLLVSGHPVDAVPAQPQPRRRWSTGLFDCLYSSPEHHGNDVEVCLTGWLCPCVLFGTTRDRLNPEPYQFAGNCCLYSGFYLLGQAILKGNVLAPIVTYPNRTEIRQRFNIEGDYSSSECLTGCCGMPSEETRELVEARCDCCVHYFCHSCALCQEAREVRRCIPHHPPVAAPVAPLVAPSMPTMV